MAHFYGSVRGARGEATRLGGTNTGLHTVCASWSGAVECRAYVKDGIDHVRVQLMRWHGRGVERVIYDGPVGELGA
jgi:hypothetical protein